MIATLNDPNLAVFSGEGLPVLGLIALVEARTTCPEMGMESGDAEEGEEEVEDELDDDDDETVLCIRLTTVNLSPGRGGAFFPLQEIKKIRNRIKYVKLHPKMKEKKKKKKWKTRNKQTHFFSVLFFSLCLLRVDQ